jgi:hypothetical protein
MPIRYNYDAEAERADAEALLLDAWQEERYGHEAECDRRTDPYGRCYCDER